MGDQPPDEPARDRIGHDLGATLFVEAGAGAGKTSSLVERIVNLVDDGVDITAIAAITFTEKAAAELRTRVRARLGIQPTERAVVALDRLDHAPIGTLHAFARRLLFDFPIEAGLPPGFTVLDELESGLAFEEQWDDLLDRLLDDPEPAGGLIDGGRAFVELCEFDRFGVRTGVRRIAQDFRANWDLVDDRVSLADPGPLVVDVSTLVTLADAITSSDVPPDDRQTIAVARIALLAGRLRGAASLRVMLEAILAAHDEFANRKTMPGNKAIWKKHLGASGESELEDLRCLEFEFAAEATRLLAAARHHRRIVLGAIVGRFVLEGAHERAVAGRLEFHDLLVLARRVVAQRGDIRRLLHGRYQRIMLDEFQDTDPIQLEIAVRLAARPDDPAHDTDWRQLVPEPGRLFIVGDPKQSIYRFRRADIAQYLRAADQVGADQVVLTANFRSTTAVIDFVNDVFGRAITHDPDVQPAFGALDARRRADLLGHGSVHVLGSEPTDRATDEAVEFGDAEMGAADALRTVEARDVVATVTTALADAWPVYDRQLDALRPCLPGDICVLLPTRISLPALEAEFRKAALPYRAENSSVVYASSEIRSLLLTLRAADDPTDSLALVASLRSPLYGCSDVELWEWAAADGSWNLWADPPEGLAGHPVAEAIAHVRSLAERTGLVSAADLVWAVADERRVFDVALDGNDARDVWRRLRFVIEQARAWADAGGHGLRRYLHWAALQASESRVADTILPEHDHDAVRVMTVHAAKGLEFPITIVAGLTTKPKRSQTAGVVWTADSWMLAGKGDDGVFVDHQPIDEQMSDAERRRLLYVACTRAVDHLVVSLHRPPPAKNNPDGADQAKLTSAELLWHSGAAGPTSGAQVGEFEPRPVRSADPVLLELAWPDPVEWGAERRRVLTTASRRSGIAATRLAAELSPHAAPAASSDDVGLDKQPVNIEQPPWQRGRYGTSIGRAVHGVLQFCDLADGHDIATLAKAQCAAEGVIGLDEQVAALARSALATPIVRGVVDGLEHWRELFVAAILVRCVPDGPAEQIPIERWADALVEVRRLVTARDDGAEPEPLGGPGPV